MSNVSYPVDFLQIVAMCMFASEHYPTPRTFATAAPPSSNKATPCSACGSVSPSRHGVAWRLAARAERQGSLNRRTGGSGPHRADPGRSGPIRAATSCHKPPECPQGLRLTASTFLSTKPGFALFSAYLSKVAGLRRCMARPLARSNRCGSKIEQRLHSFLALAGQLTGRADQPALCAKRRRLAASSTRTSRWAMASTPSACSLAKVRLTVSSFMPR